MSMPGNEPAPDGEALAGRDAPGGPRGTARPDPRRALGRPEEVADLAAAMLRNGYLTNQVVGLDGGRYPR